MAISRYEKFVQDLHNSPETQSKLAGLLGAAGSADQNVAHGAQVTIHKAFEEVLRKGTLYGDIISGLFKQMPYSTSDRTVEWPLDIIAPGSEKNWVGYTIPKTGNIPYKMAEGDYVRIDLYKVAHSIDVALDIVNDSRWDIVARMMEVLEAGIVKKLNDDGMHTILTAAADRNILVFDSDASAGQFTRRLVSLMQVTMRRNGGGNSTSLNRGKLTHLIVSPEMFEDVRNFGINQVADITRSQIFNMSDDNLARLFGDVTLVPLDEFGVGQEYQNYYLNTLSGTLAASDVEVMVGLDLNRPNGLIMPVAGNLEVFPDPMLHRSQRMGYYCWRKVGFGCLDNRVVLLASA